MFIELTGHLHIFNLGVFPGPAKHPFRGVSLVKFPPMISIGIQLGAVDYTIQVGGKLNDDLGIKHEKLPCFRPK